MSPRLLRSLGRCPWPTRPGLHASVLVLVLTAGCSTPPPGPSRPLPQVPERFQGSAAHAPAAIAGQPMGWHVFADPTLDSLMDRALQDSPTIEAAAARLMQARAVLRQVEAEPSVQSSLSTGVNRQGGPLVNAAGASGTLLTVGLGVSYEIDLFGRGQAGRDAAVADARTRECQLRAARLLVQAEVAQTYFALRSLDAELTASKADVQAWDEAVRMTEQRWLAGSVPETAVLRLRGELAAARADGAAVAQRRSQAEHALALLLGEVASRFALPATPWKAAVPSVPAGLPSDMLARRPDVAAAQWAEAAARSRSGAARSSWWPTLTLTASGGHAAPALADWLQASTRAWGLGVLTSLPLLDGGRRESGIRQADALADVESAQRRLQVLTAFKEVEDQLGALSGLAEQARHQAAAQTAAVRARALAESRFQQGLASRLEWLDAVRFELRSQRAVLQVQAAQMQGTVGLIKALGGGWQDPTPS